MNEEKKESAFSFGEYTSTLASGVDLFKEIEELKIEKEAAEQEKQRFRLQLYDGLINDHLGTKIRAHILEYLFLTFKTTVGIRDSTGQIWYLVYGGKYTNIVKQMMDKLEITKRTAYYHLEELQKRFFIQYDAIKGIGTAIGVRRIPDVFERKEFDKKLVIDKFPTQEVKSSTQQVKIQTQKGKIQTQKGKDTILESPILQKFSPTIITPPEVPSVAGTKDISKDISKDTTITEEEANAAIKNICSLFTEAGHSVKEEDIFRILIETGVGLDEAVDMTNYAILKATTNPVGYFRKIARERIKIPTVSVGDNCPIWAQPNEGKRYLSTTEKFIPFKIRRRIFDVFGWKGDRVIMEIEEKYKFSDKEFFNIELTMKEIEGIEVFINFIKVNWHTYKWTFRPVMPSSVAVSDKGRWKDLSPDVERELNKLERKE